MSRRSGNFSEPWPALPYEEFKSTAHLLHMGIQAIGKLKLLTPFEPHWANVALWLTSRGLTTGQIPYKTGCFSIDLDLITHQIICTTSWDTRGKIDLAPMSVAELVATLFKVLNDIGVDITVNPMPQEIPNPIPFDQDTKARPYDASLVNAWWRIMSSTNQVLKRYHARFTGRTPPIGLMWGSLDIRDVRYQGTPVPTTGINADYIRRNAMNNPQIEMGWWIGSPNYPRPAYFSFTYPQPVGIEQAEIQPKVAHWDTTLGEFLLDYDDLRKSKHPEQDLLDFFESAYQAGAERAGWSSELVSSGKPV
ncbi:MAG: DUF5996 family protein [Gammaproteobacteria bacterium]